MEFKALSPFEFAQKKIEFILTFESLCARLFQSVFFSLDSAGHGELSTQHITFYLVVDTKILNSEN